MASLFILVEGTAVSLIGACLATRIIEMNLAENGEWAASQE